MLYICPGDNNEDSEQKVLRTVLKYGGKQQT